ncbi:FecR family protein [Variovorax sp. LT1R16]
MDMNTQGESAESVDAAQAQREAQAWLRKLTSGAATQRDLDGFRRWQAAGPANVQAFLEAKRLWKALDPAIGQMMAERPALLAAHRQTGHRTVLPRRAFLGAATGAIGAAGVVAMVNPPWALWPSASEWRADFRTRTGEQRTLALADGVALVLNTQTSVRRRTLDGRTVGIDLIAGEAAVDLSSASVAAAPTFGVVAGAGRIESDAGRFEVRYLDGSACVTCIEGRVRVAHALGTQLLRADQQVVYDADSIGSPVDIRRVDAAAWRDGVLVFRQTPLSGVIAEINRYRRGRVVLLARGLADRAVSGRFAIASLDTVLVQIQRSYDLGARVLPGGMLLLS